MNHFYWDASALGKRYANEVGTPLVNQLFESVSANRMMVLLIGASEILSILTRRKNAGVMTTTRYEEAVAQWRTEIVNSPDFHLESTEDSLVLNSFDFIADYSLNATDAIVLRSALTVAQSLRADGHDLVLVASDSRLLGAAQSQGLLTFNPEVDGQSDLNALLAVPSAPSDSAGNGASASA